MGMEAFIRKDKTGLGRIGGFGLVLQSGPETDNVMMSSKWEGG
jgi:hypothetical protein